MVNDLVLSHVQVGDNLCILPSHSSPYIEPVLRVTKTGRVVTKTGTFAPNGYMRGGGSWHSATAHPATEDDIAGINRIKLVAKLNHFQVWSKLSADDLKAVVAIVDKYSSGRI